MPTHPIAAVPNSVSDGDRILGRVAVVALLIALVALQVRLWTGAGSLAEVATLEDRVAAQRAENRRLAEQNGLLETEVRALKEDPDSLEARARSELGMIRDGETFYMVLPPVRETAVGAVLPPTRETAVGAVLPPVRETAVGAVLPPARETAAGAP